MKKQLLIAAVAATMTSAAFADISISGAGQVNWKNTDTTGADSVNTITHDIDLKITGKSGATSVVMDIQNTNAAADSADTTAYAASDDNAAIVFTDNEMNVKNAYLATSVAGVNLKMGTWYGSDSMLGNGGQTKDQLSADYTMSGVKVQYEFAAAGSESVTISGTVAGVALSHESYQNGNTNTVVSGSFSGVTGEYRSYEQDIETANATDKSSLTLSTEINGVTLTYASVDVDGTGLTSSDAFFGENNNHSDASGFSASTSLAGNTVTVKSYDIKDISTQADDSVTKIVVKREMASGATLEVTYADQDSGDARADVESLDVELRVSF
jgi:hypothetical protein